MIQIVSTGTVAALDFDPTTISGCTGWWAADDMSGFVDGDAVGAGGADGWTNLGSAGGVLTQATANLRPTYQANEVNTTLPAVRFVNSPAGEQDRLISSGFANIGSLITVSAYTIYIVIRPTIGGGTDGSARYYRRPRIFGTNGNDNFHIGLYDTKFALNHNSVTGPKILTPNSFTVNTWNIVQVYYNGSTMSIKFNNGAEGTIAGANIPSLVTTAIIGHGTDLSLDADIAEIITYNVDIGSTDRGVVMTGLGTKYGITV